ncbi:uncharacterized protein [Littorina saxatilis]|uniref:uncharacterized protein n=1 Tax=Littorina saxatilis TaxID=31220 RepID=UPI0038B55541
MSDTCRDADGIDGVGDNMTNGAPALVFGVCLLSDGTGEQLSPLGAVVISPGSPCHIPVARLRKLIVKQITSVPPSFRFYTPQRWPVSATQEQHLNLQSLLTAEGCIFIQQTHDKPKIGIRAKTGVALGFIWSETQSTLADFRSRINSEVSFFKGTPDTCYQFLDANGWPVSKHLEGDIRVVEVLVKSCVVVCTDLVAKEALDEVDGACPVSSAEPPRKRLKGLKQLSFRSSKDIDRLRRATSTTSSADSVLDGVVTGSKSSNEQSGTHRSKKQLLISYVRAEAADYALQLKTRLAALGYSVYLDVHEISVGVDWQDSLNFAVSNCEVFIPLVTPRYGETLWTNRKVKLADVLGKYILPVNFLPDWPPRCLAIQFATTQYVVSGGPYIQALVNGGGAAAGCEASSQAASWTDTDIQTTAMEISQRIKALNKTGATLLSIPSLVRMKTLRKTFVGKLPAVKSFPSEPEGDIPPLNDDNKPLIVVCLHPLQAYFGHEVKEWLENQSYTVWLSSDDEFPAEDSDTLPATQQSQGESGTAREDGHCTNGDSQSQIAPFQSVADRAALVVVILSQDFAHSRTCKQQLFYCEQRKPLVPIHFEDFTMPGWLSMLISTASTESTNITQSGYQQTLLSRLQRVIHSVSRNNLELLSNEAKLNHAVEYIRKAVETDSCVYITGSTNFNNPKSAEICRAIGTHLARLGGLSLGTGGFYGVGETVSQAFHEETIRLWKRQDVWHVLPDRDVKQDWSKQANQNPDGTFAVAPFGKTLFCGDSVRQRESIVGRCFEICILIEGGPGAAHEAEEFVWNDRTVIPLSCTGGAASGKFSVPQKMFEIPQGVSSKDWQAITKQDLTPDQVAECVTRIVTSLLQHLSASKQQAAIDTTPTPLITPTTPPVSRSKKSSPASSGLKSTPTPPARHKSALNKMKTVLLG